MVLYFKLSVKEIYEKGESYDWPRPKRCPKCGSGRLWGHGYVARYFEEYVETLWVKRYRCVECRAVHTLKPEGYWRRFRHRVATVLRSMKSKISKNRWVAGIGRQSQQYWWRGLKRQRARVGKGFERISLSVLEHLLSEGIMVGTHSLRFFRILKNSLSFGFTPSG